MRALQVSGAHDVPGQDEVAKARSEALDLGLHALDVGGRRGRPVDLRRAAGVGPCGVLSDRSTRRVGDGLLAQEEEGPRRERAGASGQRGGRGEHVLRGAADVDGAGRARRGVGPGIGPSSAQSTLRVAGPYR